MAVQQVPREKLFVVVDPGDEEHPALERTRITAGLRRPAPVVSVYIARDDKTGKVGAGNLTRDQRWFDRAIREPLNDLLIEYEIAVSWDSQWPEELLRVAADFGSTMILLPVHDYGPSQRLVLNNAKWELLQYAPCPVLLVRPRASEKRRTILAAVNFQVDGHRQLALNDRILGHGKRVANRYTADFHVVNAYRDSLHYPDRGRLARESGLSASRIHVRHGFTDEVVAEVAHDIDADMVVIGTLNQRGVVASPRRGNTAARVIAALRADTLVVN
jgi:universal stress protein E